MSHCKAAVRGKCVRYMNPLSPIPQNTPKGNSNLAMKKFIKWNTFLSKWLGKSGKIKNCQDKSVCLCLLTHIFHFGLFTSRTFLLSKRASPHPCPCKLATNLFLTALIYFLNIYVHEKFNWTLKPFLWLPPSWYLQMFFVGLCWFLPCPWHLKPK